MFVDQHSIFFHALDCKKGGLITSCHNKLCDGVAKLAGKTFTLRHMRNDPEIFRGLAMHGGKAKAKSKETPPQDKEDLKGDILIQYLWIQRTYSIHEMHVVNTYTISYQPQTPEKCLETSEQGKNNKYLHACLNKRHKFTPFITSVDGLIGVDKEATPKILASRLATKWKEPY